MGIKSRGASVPAGTLVDFAGGTVPAGWLLCYGQAVSRADFPALFLAIGSAHGAGDGATTFNLPDARGRAIFGKDDMGGTAANRITSGVSGVNGAALGAVGGAQSVTLATSQTPAHNHSDYYQATSSSTARYGAGSSTSPLAVSGIGETGASTGTGNAGGGGAHSNIPPALVANKIIKF